MTRPLLADVVVNGVTVPATAIAAEAQHHRAPATKPGWAWRSAARALVVRELLRQEVQRRGIAPCPCPRPAEGGRSETQEEAALRSLLEAELDPEPPSEAMLLAHYRDAPDRYRSPRLFEASHILYRPAPEARARAKAALAALLGGEASFEEIARADSACPSRSAGGRLGQIAEGDTLPAFEAALTRLDPGRIAPEPVATDHGVHIIRLDARAEGAVLPFETVRPRLVAAVEKARWVRAARDYVARLVAAAALDGISFDRPMRP